MQLQIIWTHILASEHLYDKGLANMSYSSLCNYCLFFDCVILMTIPVHFILSDFKHTTGWNIFLMAEYFKYCNSIS